MWTPVSGGVRLEFDAIEVLTNPVTFQGIVNRVMDAVTEDILNTSIDLVFDKNRDGLSREDEQKMWNCIHKNKELFHRYIRVEEQSYGIFEIEADFKNTSEASAKRWLERFVEKHDLTIVKAAEACQDGDYQNDWVRAWVVVKI